MRKTLIALLASLITLAANVASAGAHSVFINGVRQSDQAVHALENAYRTRVADGDYWYDTRSGLWGREGSPVAGQIHPGLPFGGRMREQASNGDTGVLVNGRRLPRAELYTLMQLVGYVQPGRYWLDASGNAGFEGGPALINLFAAGNRGGGNGGSHGGWNRNTPGGNWGGDGECSYYSHPDGPSVMVGNC